MQINFSWLFCSQVASQVILSFRLVPLLPLQFQLHENILACSNPWKGGRHIIEKNAGPPDTPVRVVALLQYQGRFQRWTAAGTDAGRPSPRSSSYAGEQGSSLAHTTPYALGAEDWACNKKHVDEVLSHFDLCSVMLNFRCTQLCLVTWFVRFGCCFSDSMIFVFWKRGDKSLYFWI